MNNANRLKKLISQGHALNRKREARKKPRHVDPKYIWESQGRPEQQEPNIDYFIWACIAGRGWGKTRVGSEFVRKKVYEGAKHICIIAPTANDIRKTIIHGHSGLLSVFPPHEQPIYYPSKLLVEFHTGATAALFSADNPERLRGGNYEVVWLDELAAFKYSQMAYDMAMMTARIGDDPKVLITTTPKPTPLIRKLVKSQKVHVTRGSTYDNEANLSASFIELMKDEYENSRLGKQEIYAEILDDNEGALWNRDLLERQRVTSLPKLQTICVGVDPAATNNPNSAETGIIVAGADQDRNGYVLDDLSIKGTPSQWAQAAIDAYHKYDADYIVIETNQGGLMVRQVIESIEKVPIKEVRASTGKTARAEPIVTMYETGRIFHVGFFSSELESQMCNFMGNPNEQEDKCDRVDALVWACTSLLLTKRVKVTMNHAMGALTDELSKANEWGGGGGWNDW